MCHVLQSEWIPVGWALLQRLAYIPRDWLLPTPSSTYQGCRRSELKYETGFALCKRILRAARSCTERSQSFGLISVGRRFCGADEHTPLTNSRVFCLVCKFYDLTVGFLQHPGHDGVCSSQYWVGQSQRKTCRRTSLRDAKRKRAGIQAQRYTHTHNDGE